MSKNCRRISGTVTASIIAMFFLIAAGSAGNAATISAPALHLKAYKADPGKVDPYWPTDPVLCDLVLDGEIEEGDSSELVRLVHAIANAADRFTFFFCLRSSGGSVKEAIKIARFL